MPVFIASDMHLRFDRPERAHRLSRWVQSLRPDDPLYLAGDVCDFVFASRQVRSDPMACQGLRALADYRARGGPLTILLGNHDLWLGPFYERVLGARVVPEPLTVDAYGLRIVVSHGHRTGGREPWKAAMESRAFLGAFGVLPTAVAGWLDDKLHKSNDVGRSRDEARLVSVFRRSLDAIDPAADVAVFGHVHTPLDDPTSRPRLVVLGGWHARTSYLCVDERGASLVVKPDASRVRV